MSTSIDPLDDRRHDLPPSVMAKIVANGQPTPSQPLQIANPLHPRISAHTACDPDYESDRYSSEEHSRPPSMLTGLVETMDMDVGPEFLLGNPEAAMLMPQSRTGWKWGSLATEQRGRAANVPRKTSGKARIGRQSVAEEGKGQGKRTFSHRLSDTLFSAGRSVKQTWNGMWRKDSLVLPREPGRQYEEVGRGEDADDERSPELSRESLANGQHSREGRFQPTVSVREEVSSVHKAASTSDEPTERRASLPPAIELPASTTVRAGRDGYIIEHIEYASQPEESYFPAYGMAVPSIDEEQPAPLIYQSESSVRQEAVPAIEDELAPLTRFDAESRQAANELHSVLHKAVTKADRKGSFSETKRTRSFGRSYAHGTTEWKQWKASIELREENVRAQQKRNEKFLRDLQRQRSPEGLRVWSWGKKVERKSEAAVEESEPLISSEEEVQRGRSPPSRGFASSSAWSRDESRGNEADEIAKYGGTALQQCPSVFC